MDSLDKYVFKTGFSMFLLVLFSLTGVIWVTQILRQIDLITGQGQTVLTFIGITSMIIPTLMLILAPIAMLIAVVYTLTKLNGDSELVVMSAAGVSPRRLFRPFAMLAAVVSMLVMIIAVFLSPFLQREMNDRLAKVRADVVANIVRPGTFTSIERGLTFHIREKKTDSQFGGILIDDFRDPKERASILAEQGNIVQTGRGTYLVMTDGWVQRRRASDRDPTMVKFERYAFDLSPYTVANRVSYGLRERYLWELLFPDPDDKLLKTSPNQFRVELNDRLVAPLYPIAFVVLAYMLMCTPRSTRQGRVGSTAVVIVGVFALRILGFACMAIGQSSPIALYLLYPVLLGAIGLGLFAIYTGRGLERDLTLDLAMLRSRLLARLPRPAWR
ncbi:LPS export ABC transporter permease LptF [Rhodoplanes elegans]|uniref:LPS export ABC transporter permease LptF n=1 Tax=Rhodoplanes elegans TaxID=29408 RepID=A0A327K533_9BRAD|nr:LPS export ABC transporter permease LptF [Rhodoplanes elegans]MBK5959866.1 LPS export ABC transporter permease LptF [Rhodoplanes elegans]RAI33799.1 LPS export ABC transporter permease LptF [Rhodoplanes elegans]